MKEWSQDRIRQVLVERGIRPSYQRMRILEYMIGSREHPSVDQVYRDLLPHIPTLSKTTVYNTLALFRDQGLVVVLAVGENEFRYDTTLRGSHAHFFCRSCGTLEDIDLTEDLPLCPGLPEYRIELTQVYMRGICHSCNGKRGQGKPSSEK